MKLQTHLKNFIFIAMIVLAECGSNWRMHEAERATENQISKPNESDWLKGKVKQDSNVINYVGRSSARDMPCSGWLSNGAQAKTSDGRTGLTVMDERDRDRRVKLEDIEIKTELSWQETERKWTREEEVNALECLCELDKDRETLAGKRFKVTQLKQV